MLLISNYWNKIPVPTPCKPTSGVQRTVPNCLVRTYQEIYQKIEYVHIYNTVTSQKISPTKLLKGSKSLSHGSLLQQTTPLETLSLA